jgi:hypothetical protein
MKNKALLTLLAIVFIGVANAHLQWRSEENGYLLTIDNRPVDMMGMVDHFWTKTTTDCKKTKLLSEEDQRFKNALALIKGYSPPDSNSAVVSSMTVYENWALVEVEFKELLPAVVLIDSQHDTPEIIQNAVWSGYTNPWKSAPLIGKYMLRQVPNLPLALINCFEPQSESFK